MGLWNDVAPFIGIIAILTMMAYSLVKKRFMTFSVIGGCIIIFILQMTSVDYIGAQAWQSSTATMLGYETIFLVSEQWRLYTLFTCMFVHSGPMHLIFNMVALILIGVILEERIGTYRYALIYFLSGLFAALFFSLFHPFSHGLLIGASGAFCGVLGAFARLYPKEKIRMFLLFILMPPMPMYVVAILFLFLETLFAYMGGFNLVGLITDTDRNVAHMAHIGGFIFGLVIAPWVMDIDFKDAGKVRSKVKVDMDAIERLALTDQQKEILEKIRKEDEPDVKRVWIEELARKARCPDCGRKLDVRPTSIRCRCGFKVKFR